MRARVCVYMCAYMCVRARTRVRVERNAGIRAIVTYRGFSSDRDQSEKKKITREEIQYAVLELTFYVIPGAWGNDRIALIRRGDKRAIGSGIKTVTIKRTLGRKTRARRCTNRSRIRKRIAMKRLKDFRTTSPAPRDYVTNLSETTRENKCFKKIERNEGEKQYDRFKPVRPINVYGNWTRPIKTTGRSG